MRFLDPRRRALARPCAAATVVLAITTGCGPPGELHPFATSVGTESSSSDTDGPGAGTSIVYVRCPRTTAPVEISGEVTVGGQAESRTRVLEHADIYDAFPEVMTMRSGFTAPCDLMLRDAAGQDSILYDCSAHASMVEACAAFHPAVSFDGKTAAFTVYRGSLIRRNAGFVARMLDPAAENEDEYFVELPNVYLEATGAHLALVDLTTGETRELPFVEGQWDVAPAWMSDGRIAFVSDREGIYRPTIAGLDYWRAFRLHAMATDGRDVESLGVHAMAGQRAPVQLADGRLAHASWELFGLLPYRYNSGVSGGFGTFTNYVHLYAHGPHGQAQHALYGQHLLIGSPSHFAAHDVGQTGDGRIWVADYGSGITGIGTVHGFPPPAPGHEGVGPVPEPDLNDLYRPEGFVRATPWASADNVFAGTMPDPPLPIPGYADPLALVGKAGHPAGMPDGGLMVTWGKGACGTVAVLSPELIGDPPPPLTSGSGSLVEMNALTLLGLDNPGCDLGVYALTELRSVHPSDLQVLVDSPEYHELMAVPAVPYAAVHGIQTPAEVPPPEVASAGDPELPVGTPFGILGAASMLLRETRTVGGQPFEGERQWALQGSDALDYDDAEICGVRVLAVMPNRMADSETMSAPAGLRVSIVGEVSVRNFAQDGSPIVDPLGMSDTSFRVRIPAKMPYLLQAIDCQGRTLSSEQVPQHLRPAEDRTCNGCHRTGGPGLDFGSTHAGSTGMIDARLGEGTVQLLTGGTPPATTTSQFAAFGVQYEFERDVLPIFQVRCAQCHSGTTAAAGLVLDLPGREDGSTWWRLVQDNAQQYVPIDQRHDGTDPQDRLRKPQLSKYVRFMNARGSLLYWKAANARTDGRTDAQYGNGQPSPDYDDVDFGADHPTEITAEELAVLSRWIDTGAAAGAGFLVDTLPPTLSVAADPGARAVSRLYIGTADVGSGVDPASLEVCVLSGGACGPDLAGDAALAGTVVVDLGMSLDDPELEVRVRVRDVAGNLAELTRTVGGLLGETSSNLQRDPQSGDRVAGFTFGCSTGGGSAPRWAWGSVLLFVAAWAVGRRRRAGGGS